MALFGTKNKTEKKSTTPSAVIRREMGPVGNGAHTSFTRIIIHPRITEKASVKSESGVYTFDITKDATKGSVKTAVQTLFKVTPVKVAIVPVKSKKILARGKRGESRSGKKAYVYLKKGDKIEFV